MSDAPRAVDATKKPAQIEPCKGCGQTYTRQLNEQTRCAKCILSLVAAAGDLPTAAAQVALQKLSSTPDWKRAVSLEDVVLVLNELLAQDSRAISDLARYRVRVNVGIVHHPAAKTLPADNGHYYMGVMGLLNAVFGEHRGYGAISMEQFEDGVGHVRRFLKTEEALNQPEVEKG